MATVYLAADLRHPRNVALKVLRPDLAADLGAARFLDEIRTTAKLQHPHILRLYDSGEADGLLFYVTEHVEGESLRARLGREHQLPVDEAVRIATNLAEALDHAHRNGVVHRDVKPENILLLDGKPLLADFGIALATSGSDGRRTEAGHSLGTPRYMSPEQATGDVHVGHATDIWALGCVLYEMLVGEPPYTGSTPQAVLGRIITAEPPSATEVRKTVPPSVDAAIRKALEKIPADRFKSAGELARALGDVGFQHGEVATAAVGPWTRATVGFALLAAITILILSGLLLRSETTPPSPSVERFAVDAYDPSTVGFPALLPDGSGVVYGVGQLNVRRWSSLDPVPVPGTEGASGRTSPAVSPSGEDVAFITTDGELKVAPVAGGTVRTLTQAANPCCMRWARDGFVYFAPVTMSGNIQRVAQAGGSVEEVIARDTGTGSLADFQLLPDGDVGVFTSNWFSTTSVIEAVRLSTGERRVVTSGIKPYVTTTGHLVFGSSEGQILAAPFDAEAMELTGPVVTLLEGVHVAPPYAGAGVYPAFSVTEDGTTLVYAEAGTGVVGYQLAIVDLQGSQRILPLAPRTFSILGPSWVSDGESVIFSSEQQIYTYDVIRNTTPRQITFEGLNNRPVSSPDGARVAFSSLRPGTNGYDVFVAEIDGDEPPRSLLTLDGAQFLTAWPADTLLLFESLNDGNGDLWLLDLSDEEAPRARPYLTSEANLRRFVLSPDGGLAAYQSDESGTAEIYVNSFPTPGSAIPISRGGGGGPYWSIDGATLYHNTPRGEWIAARLSRESPPTVLSVDTLFRAPTAVPPFPGSALHPDKDRFILAVNPSTEGETAQSRRLIVVQSFLEELEGPLGGGTTGR